MGYNEPQPLKMLTAMIHFYFSMQKVPGAFQIFQNKIQVSLKNFNFKIVKKKIEEE